MPHVILCCKSSLVASIYLERLLESCFNEVIPLHRSSACTFETIEYRTSPFYHEINLERISNSDKNTFTSLLNSIVNHTSFSKRRHIIILNNIDKMPSNVETTLHSIIEKYSQTTWFVMVSTHVSKIPILLGSRCLTINLQVNMKHIFNKLKPTFVNEQKIDDMLLVCEQDPLNMCILLELKHPENYRTHLFGFVYSYLDEMICSFRKCSIKPNSEHYLAYSSCLREFVTKISASCVLCKDVAMQIIKYTSLYYPNRINAVLDCVVEMEHLCHVVNKHIFVYESCIDKVIQILA